MSVYANQGQFDRSAVILRGDRIALCDKSASSSTRMTHIDYGLSVLMTETILTSVPPGQVSDLAVLYNELSRHGRLAIRGTSRFFEIGSVSGLADLEQLLHSKAVRTDDPAPARRPPTATRHQATRAS